MSNLEVALKLTAKDDASKTTNRTFSNLERSAKSASSAILRDSQRLSQARETLGIRSEKTIQREIRQTEAAYKRLAQSGRVSAQELARAQQTATQRVAKLRQEMQSAARETATLGQRLGSLKQFAGKAIAGATAAGYVLMQPARRQMTFEKHLALAANDIYADRDVAGRRQGMREMQDRVESLDQYGGDKTEKLETYRSMAGSGAFGSGQAGLDNAGKLLPHMAQATAGNEISMSTLGKFLTVAKKKGGLKDGDESWAIDALLRGYKDAGASAEGFAQSIIAQMDTSRAAGFSGREGLRNLMAHNVVLAQQSGDGEGASDKLRNTLTFITSPSVQKALADSNLRVRNSETGKVEKIDLQRLYMSNSQKGIDNLTTFLKIARGMVESDKNYKALQARAAKLAPADREKFLDDNMGVVEKSALGKLGLPREVLRTILMGLTDPEAIKAAQERSDSAAGEARNDYSLVSATNANKLDAFNASRETKENQAIQPFADLLGSASEKLTAYANEYPELTKTLAGVTLGLKAFAAGLAASGIAGLVMGGKAVAGAVGASTVATGATVASGAAVGGSAAAGGGVGAGTLLAPAAFAITLGVVASRVDDTDRANASQRMRSARYGMGRNPGRDETTEAAAQRGQPSSAAPVPQAPTAGAISGAGTEAVLQLLPQLTTIAGNTDSSAVVSGLDKVAGGIDQLVAQPHTTNVATNLYLPGVGLIAQAVMQYIGDREIRG